MKPQKTAFVDELAPITVRLAGSSDMPNEKIDAWKTSLQRDDQRTLLDEDSRHSIDAANVVTESTGHEVTGRTLKLPLVKNLGIAGFLFFTLKGMVWLVAGYAAVKANGCTTWGS